MEQLPVWTMLLRMVLAMAFGGAIGLEREHKRMPAGFRTYMLVCLGAALSVMLSCYQYTMMHTVWAAEIEAVGADTDVSRYGAAVISGIGFLGAGTIIVTEKKEIKGVTTAAGLWASACMGLAIGAGFYSCALAGLLIIFLSVTWLPNVEDRLAVHSGDITLYIEFTERSAIGEIIAELNSRRLEVLELELGLDEGSRFPSVMARLKIPRGLEQSELIMQLTQLRCIRSIHRM